MPVIISAIERGQSIQMTVSGSSMTPFIYDGDDVEIVPLKSEIRKGDIVLAKSSEGYYVIHRIIKIKKDLFNLRGDAQDYAENFYNYKNIIGKISISVHNGAERNHSKGFWKFAGFVWIFISPAGNVLYSVYKNIKRISRKVIRGFYKVIRLPLRK